MVSTSSLSLASLGMLISLAISDNDSVWYVLFNVFSFHRGAFSTAKFTRPQLLSPLKTFSSFSITVMYAPDGYALASAPYGELRTSLFNMGCTYLGRFMS